MVTVMNSKYQMLSVASKGWLCFLKLTTVFVLAFGGVKACTVDLAIADDKDFVVDRMHGNGFCANRPQIPEMHTLKDTSCAGIAEAIRLSRLSRDTKVHIESVEDLLKVMPLDLRSKFNLMYQSESIQGASPLQPRVVMYGNRGPFITFNGSKEQSGGDSVEVLQFNERVKNFELCEFDFSERARLNDHIYSGINPPKCLSCHANGEGPEKVKPIWEPYPQWPGAVSLIETANPTVNLVPKDELARDINFHKNFESLRNQPRYRQLFGIADSLYISDHVRTRFHDLLHSGLVCQAELENYAIVEKFTANAGEMDELLSAYNFQRIDAIIKKDFPQYKYAILGIVNCPRFYDQNLDGYGSTPVDVVSSLEKINRFIGDEKLKVSKVIDQNYNPFPKRQYNLSIGENLIVSLMQSHGYDIENWFMSLDVRRRYGMSLPTRADLRFTDWLIGSDDELSARFIGKATPYDSYTSVLPAKTYKLNENDCEWLAEKSRKVLVSQNMKQGLPVIVRNRFSKKFDTATASAFRRKETAAAGVKRPPGLFNTCLGCHQTGNFGAPQFGLELPPEQFEVRLKANSCDLAKRMYANVIQRDGRANMPPVLYLTHKDQQRYLKEEYPRLTSYLRDFLNSQDCPEPTNEKR